jgi:hypothetical protein
VETEELDEPAKVYNFEVEGFHTYFVGSAVQVLVHNTCNRGVGGEGWEGDATWRSNVNTVSQGGTIENLNGVVPSQSEAVNLIGQAGGDVVRIEGAHALGGISPHIYPHINYTTAAGRKGTIQILEVIEEFFK